MHIYLHVFNFYAFFSLINPSPPREKKMLFQDSLSILIFFFKVFLKDQNHLGTC